MKAMILAAGLGTRLKPFTNSTPKALVPILGKPVIEHVILKLKAHGFNENNYQYPSFWRSDHRFYKI